MTFNELIEAVEKVRDDQSSSEKEKIMADGLIWALKSNRTPSVVEQYLMDNDVEAIIKEFAATWDGEDHISGAYCHVRDAILHKITQC